MKLWEFALIMGYAVAMVALATAVALTGGLAMAVLIVLFGAIGAFQIGCALGRRARARAGRRRRRRRRRRP